MQRREIASLYALCGHVLPAITMILQANSTCPSRGIFGVVLSLYDIAVCEDTKLVRLIR